MEITIETKCPCEADACACCACVSMHCDECHGHSKFQQGRYCSHCGRPLKAELQRNYVPKSEVEALEKEVERLTNILNSYALQYGTVADKQKLIDGVKAEVAREIFEEIEEEIEAALNNNYTKLKDCGAERVLFFEYVNGKITCLRGIEDFITELKKKYTEDKG